MALSTIEERVREKARNALAKRVREAFRANIYAGSVGGFSDRLFTKDGSAASIPWALETIERDVVRALAPSVEEDAVQAFMRNVEALMAGSEDK
jgi:hypothetical protein